MLADDLFRVLSLDGGGAKGFYSLGVLRQIEGLTGKRLCDVFDVIFGTSTGSIIGTMLALGYSVQEIIEVYDEHVLSIMSKFWPASKSAALAKLSDKVFEGRTFADLNTNVGIVTTKWASERPMIFKTDVKQAFSSRGTFVPGFGASLGAAVQASCSAKPFFHSKKVQTNLGMVELVDGGYCANNPTLYAIADARNLFKVGGDKLRVVSIGVGEYPLKKRFFNPFWWARFLPSVRLLQKTLEINTQSMDQLREVLFQDVKVVRINKAYTEPAMATDLFEDDKEKLHLLLQRGNDSYREFEPQLREYLVS